MKPPALPVGALVRVKPLTLEDDLYVSDTLDAMDYSHIEQLRPLDIALVIGQTRVGVGTVYNSFEGTVVRTQVFINDFTGWVKTDILELIQEL